MGFGFKLHRAHSWFPCWMSKGHPVVRIISCGYCLSFSQSVSSEFVSHHPLYDVAFSFFSLTYIVRKLTLISFQIIMSELKNQRPSTSDSDDTDELKTGTFRRVVNRPVSKLPRLATSEPATFVSCDNDIENPWIIKQCHGKVGLFNICGLV